MANSEWNGLPLPAAWSDWPPVWKHQVIAHLQGRTLQAPIRWSELSFREKQLIVWHLCAVGSVSPADNPRVRILGGGTAYAAMRKAQFEKQSGGGMLCPKPNDGKRILPSVYTKLTEKWLRANRQYQKPEQMNQGHLANTIALLNESHVNLVDRMSDVLGRMHNHLSNRPDLQGKIVDLFHELEVLQVEDLYPIIELLASHVQPEMNFEAEDDSWIREF